MRRSILVVLSVLLLGTVAGAAARPVFGNSRKNPPDNRVIQPAFYWPAGSFGTLIPDTASTVIHLTWNGSALVDAKGNSWTQNGTVPQVAGGSSPFFPNGFSNTSAAGAGPLSTSNYYQISSTDPANTGTVSVCVVYQRSAAGAGSCILDNEDTTGPGGWAFHGASGAATFCYNKASGGGNCLGASTTTGVGAWNIACGGYDPVAQKMFVKSGAAAATSSSSATAMGISNTKLQVGTKTTHDLNCGAAAWDGIIYEVWVSTETPTTTLLDTQAANFLGLMGSSSQRVAFARNSGMQCTINGTRYFLAPDMPCINESGVVVEPSATNVLLNSTAPTTVTTASLGTNPYTGWMEGTGQAVFSVGTATATGLPCTATAGVANDCHFTITVAGTIVATVSGGPSTFQLEANYVRTSFIKTTGTTAARVAGIITWPSVLTQTEGCAETDLMANNWSGTPSGVGTVAVIYKDSNNRPMYILPTSANIQTYDATHNPNLAAAYTAGVFKTYASFWSASKNQMYIKNITAGTTSSITAFTTFPGALTGPTMSAGQGSPYTAKNVKMGTAINQCK